MSCTLHSTHCNKLQDIDIHCNALQHTVTDCNTLQCTALHCNTLQLTASHYKKLKHTALHTATHCNTLQQTAIPVNVLSTKVPNNARIQVNVSDITMGTLQQSATHTATNCNTHCNTHYNTSGQRVMYKNPKQCTNPSKSPRSSNGRTATNCKHTATRCNTHYNTADGHHLLSYSQQYTATYCNTLKHTATHTATPVMGTNGSSIHYGTATLHQCGGCLLYQCNAGLWQRTATQCNSLQRTATHCNTLWYGNLASVRWLLVVLM